MTVEIEPPGQLQELLEILRRRRWQVILPAALIVALGTAFAVIVPKKYTVSTEVELRETFLQTKGAAIRLTNQAREAESATYQIRSSKRLRGVVEKLKWPEYLTLSPEEQFEFLKDLQEDVTVTVPRKPEGATSSYVTIEYKDTDPQRAVEFLRELRTQWIESEVEKGRSAVKAEYDVLLAQREALEEERRKKDLELTDLRASYGLSPTQPLSASDVQRDEDPVFAALERHRDQLQVAQIDLAETQSTVEAIQKQLEEIEPKIRIESEVGGRSFEDEIRARRLEIAKLQVKLEGYKPQHSKYTTTRRMIEALESEIEQLETMATEAEVEERWVTNPDYAPKLKELEEATVLRDAKRGRRDRLLEVIASEEEQVRERQQIYSEARLRQEEIMAVAASLRDLEIRLQNKRQELEVINGPAGNPFQIIQQVNAPTSPSQPSAVLIIIFSLVAGFGVGLAGALLIEFSKSCFRNPGELSRVMVVPVLGVVNTIRTERQLRRARLRRATVGLASSLFVAAVLFVAWAWAHKPEFLAPGVLDAIEGFRTLLR